VRAGRGEVTTENTTLILDKARVSGKGIMEIGHENGTGFDD
jgi:hypothetical protein